jgi:acyl carrier protein
MSATHQIIIDYIHQEIILDEEDGDRIGPEQDLLGSGILDSMAVMRLIAFIEEEFKISVAPQDMTIENFHTVHTIGTYIAKRGGAT